MASFQGRAAEYAFAAKACENDLVVGFPSIEHIPFDYFIFNGSKTYKIQVKSTGLIPEPGQPYKVTAHKGGVANRAKYTEADCDFLVVFLANLKLFYIIPIKALDTFGLTLYPDRISCKWNLFKEAWEGLK